MSTLRTRPSLPTDFRIVNALSPLVLLTCLTSSILVLSPASAQDTPDWDTRPALEAPPAFTPPSIQSHTLSNGLPVLFVEKPGVPLVQINLLVRTGSVDDGLQDGLARFATDMMDEGAGDRDALELADAIDFLGVRLGVGAGLHHMEINLWTPHSKLYEALPLLADIALRPTFSETDLERVRTSTLTSLAQRADEPRAIAGVALARALYGTDHPYGRTGDGTPETIGALTRADLVAFHDRAVRPSNAAVVVVGAIAWNDIQPRLEAAFGSTAWSSRSALAATVIRQPEAVGPRRVILVDKPGAAQTVVRIARIGAARSTDDFHALGVLNTILGGSFTSRLNQNLRERNGYTYGAGSFFDFRPVSGPFVASADVQTAVTGPALTEFFNELAGMATIPDAEAANAREYRALSYPSPFASVGGTASRVGDLWLDDLPEDTFARYASDTRSVSSADLARVARQYVTPDEMVVVLVGDRAAIEADVRALDLGPMEVLSIEDVLGATPE